MPDHQLPGTVGLGMLVVITSKISQKPLVSKPNYSRAW